MIEPFEYFRQEEENRLNQLRSHEIHLLNNEAKNLIQRFNGFIDLMAQDSQVIEQLNQHLVQSSVLDLCYANNFESPKALAVQVFFLEYLINKYNSIESNTLLLEVKVFLDRMDYFHNTNFANHKYFLKDIITETE